MGGEYVNVSTVSDGLNGWQCIGYDGCDIDGNGNADSTVDVMSCSCDGGHVYPIVNGENIANSVIWNFFQKYSKNPDQISNSNKKNRSVICCIAFAYCMCCRPKQRGYQGVNPDAPVV